MNIAIYTRNKNEAGKWKYTRLNTGPGKGNWKRQGITPVGPFYLRYSVGNKRRFDAAGNTLEEALRTATKLQPVLETQAEEAKVARTQNGLETKTEAFLAETQANKARKTWLAYSNTMRYFLQSCDKKFVESIEREDLLEFKTHLRKEGLSDRSVYNNFLNAMVFLKWCGLKPGVKGGDWPNKPEREPEEYSDEEIEKLLMAADSDERLVLNSFLCSGVRSAELAHMTYGDIDYKHSVWKIRPKDGWQTKTEASQRDVPVAAWLTQKIQRRKDAAGLKNADLIFPNEAGKPNGHLIRIVKRVAKRASVGGRVDDHKFRSTAITRWLRDGVAPQDVMYWVGHRDLATILRYSAKLKVQKAAALSGQAFQQFAAMGGD